MALSEKELLEVLELFQKSGWEDMQLRSGNLQLSISKTGRQAPPRAQPRRRGRTRVPATAEFRATRQ